MPSGPLEPTVDNAATLVLALGAGTHFLDLFGQVQQANAVRERITTIGSEVGDRAAIPLAVSIGMGGVRDAYAKEDPCDALMRSDAALAIHESINHKIGDPAYRKTFLENVPENRKTLDLGRQWLGEST